MRLQSCLAVSLAMLSSPALAHHSEAAYDHDVIEAFEGTVTRMTWRNPHIFVFVETTNDAGETVEWKLETGSTPVMTRSGWSPDILVPGERIVVRTHPEYDRSSHVGILLTIEKADGTVLAQDDVLIQPVAEAEGFSGVWKKRSTDSNDYTERLVNLGVTQKGAEAQAAYDIATENPLDRCIPFPAPRLVDTFTYVFEFEEQNDRMLIYSEYLDAYRTVWMDGREHPEDGERTHMGHSIGHWEGDTLVVDTRLFADHRSPNRNGVPSGVQKHVVERYRLSDDRTRMLVEVFMEDPEYLTETFEGTVTYYYSPLLKLYKYNCNPA